MLTSNLIIISNRLPISVKKTQKGLEFFSSPGGLTTGMAGYAKDKKCKWVGWPGIANEKLTELDKIAIKKKLKKNNCYPVFLNQKQIDGFYYGYSNSILWPLFHNLKISPSNLSNQSNLWKCYQEVNKVFADAVLKLHDCKSSIWINDYHLFILPAILRKQHFDDRIGFFLHIPFPNPEAFTSIDNARDIILGVLGAELVGLHTEDYAKNLIDSCQKLNIGLLTEDCIALDDRIIRITNFPMGIDYARYNRSIKFKSVKKSSASIRNKHKDKKIILTIDRLEPAKGLVERIKAYRDLLETNEKLREKITLVMLVVPSRTAIEEYDSLHVQIEALIHDINCKFKTDNWTPIDYSYTCMPFEKIVALYQAADIAFIAPLIDGMNLVAKEYVATKNGKDGVLILSEYAGAAKQLHDAIIVNPNKPGSLVQALAKAISMTKAEQHKRMKNMLKNVSTYTAKNWANKFLNSLEQSPAVIPTKPKPLSDDWKSEMLSEYSIAMKRTLLLDYDGTLREFVDRPELASPSSEIKSILNNLASKKKNNLVIISGRDKNSLGEWFSDVPITLVVEHGSFERKAGTKRWINTNNLNTSWKPMILNIFEQYVAKVPGSFVENKESSLVWHYRVVKPYYVKQYLSSLIKILVPLAEKLNLKIEQGNMVLEVRPNGISKGISAIKHAQETDFVLAIGDDTTDEEMFLALPPSAWTIKVGPRQTAAKYRVKDVGEVHRLLEKLIENPKN